MQFYSTNNLDIKASFKEALLSGVAADGGLYMPGEIPKFSEEALQEISDYSFSEVAFEIAKKFIGSEIPEQDLRAICVSAYNFPVPLVELSDDEFVLELFEGPSMAFKDFAARFMARCTSYFLKQGTEKRNILVATSGDTGGAIGNSFLGIENVNVFILYPKGGVSHIQEQQLTTMGKNVFALEIEGNFDECQRMVKEIFADHEFNEKHHIMSANSINIGRILPQSFYYMWSALKLHKKSPDKKIIYSVPSGNMGNVTGGVFAKLMGAPIEKFIVANNQNHPFIDYLKTLEFAPAPAVETLSNAMDIGHPNNFYRLKHLFPSLEEINEFIIGDYFDDAQTTKEIVEVSEKNNYIMCPHTAVAHLGIRAFKPQFRDHLFVTVSTAHPAKFIETMNEILEREIDTPERLQAVLDKTKKSTVLKPQTEDLKVYLEKVLY